MSVVLRRETGPGEQLASLNGILPLQFCGYSSLSSRAYTRDFGEEKDTGIWEQSQLCQ